MTEDNGLDKAIDAIARDMTGGEPAPGLATRVRERIEMPRPARGWTWQVAAGVAVLLIIAYVSWPNGDRRHAPAPVVATGSAPERPAPRPVVEAVKAATRSTAPVRAQRRLSAFPVHIDTDAPQIAGLGEMEELIVPVAQPRDLTVSDLTVREVTLAPLEPEQKERR